jgi:hypothetical protein
MSDQSEGPIGGTKIQRRAPPQMPQEIPRQMPQQMPQPMPQVQEIPQQMQYQMPHQMPQVQQMPRQMPQVQQMQSQMPKENFNFIKSKFGDSNATKNAVLVAVIFVLLNSKIIWKQISRLPMMGSFEPTILALLVNSILAGIVFYIISKKLI